MPDTLWERVKYRRRFIGKVSRDGVVYKKYMKVRRFRSAHLRLLFILIGGLFAARLVARFLARLDAPPAAVDAMPVESE